MLSRRRRWTLLALAVVLLTALLSTGSPLADHDRTDGTWTPLVEWQEVRLRHHNPWVCTNPPNTGPPSFTELDCEWPFGTHSYVYQGTALGSSAPRDGLVVTSCDLEAGSQPDCGHSPNPNGQWTFAGSNHPIHKANVALQHGWLCPASAGGSGFNGATYDADGHKTGTGPGPATCGTFVSSTPSVSISDVTVSEDAGTARLPVTVSGSGSGSGVNYATANGTATAGSDYRAQTASLPNLVGGQSYTVNVPITDDSDVEGSETFTVTLSGALGVDIGTATATVTIIDDDSATPPPCPDGQTGTPPNCAPIVTPTGCAAPHTRLSSLTVTADGSNVLSGFSATTYSYSLTVDESSVRVAATAATGTASVRIGRGSPSTGSATRTVSMSPGGNYDISVVVTSAGESCTYTLELSRPDDDTFLDCPAGTILLIDFGFSSCQPVADCPYDLYGLDPAYLQSVGARMFGPLWTAGASVAPAVAEGGTSTVSRTAVSCTDYWRTPPSTSHTDPLRHCVVGYAENHLHPSGDCMKFSLSVAAVSPEGETAGWHYVVRGCGYNRSGDIVGTWTADDAVCSSADGAWERTRGCIFHPSLCASQAPTVDIGDWTVALGALTEASTTQDNPYVHVPVDAAITDWGELSALSVTITSTTRYLDQRSQYFGGGHWVYWSVARWQENRAGHFASATVEFPRRSGPPPSDDLYEINIAEIAALPNDRRLYSPNEQFLEILRTDLLSNDACEIGLDCTDPDQWPVQIVGQGATRCPSSPFLTSFPPLSTPQGMVGCDRLNDISDPTDPANVKFWPRLWAAGADTFQYETYGGTATVTVTLTDQPPIGDITVFDPGTRHTIATYDTPTIGWATRCLNYIWPVCRLWEGTPYADYSLATTDFSASHHTGAVPIGDPDDDIGDVTFRDGQNSHLTGRLVLNNEDHSTWRWNTDANTETQIYGGFCYSGVCYTVADVSESIIRQTLSTPVNTATATATTINMETCGASTYRRELGGTYTWGPYGSPPGITAPATAQGWNAPTDTDPDCIPRVADECLAASLLYGALCYAVWPHDANPAPLVVDYRACDERFDAFDADRTRAEAAGRTDDDYCTDGTITVLLGSLPTVTVGPVSATEGSPLQFPVTLNTAAAVDVTVTFSTQPDTTGTDPAEAADYLPRTDAQVTIPAGQAQATATVFTTQDSIYENDETLRVTLTDADLATLGSTVEAVGTITNDDAAPEVSITGASADESGMIIFDLSLSAVSHVTARVAVTTTAANPVSATGAAACVAVDGSQDYRTTAQNVTFAATATTATFTVDLCDDTMIENDETFFAALSSAVNASVSPTAWYAVGTIVDNDKPVCAITEMYDSLLGTCVPRLYYS